MSTLPNVTYTAETCSINAAPRPNFQLTVTNQLNDFPSALEYLTRVNQLLIHQKVDVLEALIGYEEANRYTIKNSLGQNVYSAVEISDCFLRNFCFSPKARPFEIKIFDNFNREVIHVCRRSISCSGCCFPCCLQKIEVFSPPGTFIGSVEQEWAIFKWSFAVKNANRETVLKIKGNLCPIGFCSDVDFVITSVDGKTIVGKITKQWSGLFKEMCTKADRFAIIFPLDLDVKIKAVLLAGCFLIDFMFFEE